MVPRVCSRTTWLQMRVRELGRHMFPGQCSLQSRWLRIQRQQSLTISVVARYSVLLWHTINFKTDTQLNAFYPKVYIFLPG